MSICYHLSGYKKGGESLLSNTGKINPTPFSVVLKRTLWSGFLFLGHFQPGFALRDIELEHQITIVYIAAATGSIPEKAAGETILHYPFYPQNQDSKAEYTP